MAPAIDPAQILLVLLVAFGASTLTLFSGFGLGTLLLPAFAFVLPLEAAIGATAIVHLANNLVKTGLLGRLADQHVVLRFGVPAMLAAFLGAAVLARIDGASLHVVVGSLIALFGVMDLVPRLRSWPVDRRHLPLGGVLSGFFGGLTGHQGALRSTFLTKLGLDAKTFVATGTLCAVFVDVARLIVYGTDRFGGLDADAWLLVAAACATAFAGAVIGKRLLGKTRIETIHLIVGVLLVVTGILIAAGLV